MSKSKTKLEAGSSLVDRLANAIAQATKSARFCASGRLSVVDPGLEVEGLGVVKLPLRPAMVKKLVARCQVAPYGKGAETLVDTGVRKTFELDPREFRLGDAWKSAIAEVTRVVAEPLGLPSERLEARLYKLLLYERGGFFLPHRDTEKHDRMVASLIVVLPNPFEGGRLVVRHGVVTEEFRFKDAAAGKTPSYAAFYADCEHEVKRISHGVRLCLAYNLVLKPNPEPSSAIATPSVPTDDLATPLGAWLAKQPEEPLVFALDHHYTEHGLSLDLLKGGDREIADLVVRTVARSDCLVHLAQVTRHLSQFADDGSFGAAYSRHAREPRRREIEIGETYEDELRATEWADLRGEKQPWGAIGLHLSAIVSSTPINDWKPTSEEFQGYTGNAGNTLDRWYHRSALVVWHRDQHFAVVARCGADESLPLFRSMVAKLAKTPKKQLEASRGDCIRFARAIIARWPRQHVRLLPSSARGDSPYLDFPTLLLKLHDRDSIAMFLTKLAEQDQMMSLRTFVLAACREFGWGTFAEELKQLLASRTDQYGERRISPRDLEWLSAFCTDPTVDPDRSALARDLCVEAAERFCEPRPSYSTFRDHRHASDPETSLPLLIQALAISGGDDGLPRVLRFVEQSPDVFSLDHGQVPALKSLIPWSRRRFGSVPPHLAAWLTTVRRRLEAATALKPMPPTDWARPANLPCKCPYCVQLKAFLADPTSEIGRITAPEEQREHVINIIARHQSDVDDSLDRKGRPFSLILTKTTGSFDRALKRFEEDRQLLSELPTTS